MDSSSSSAAAAVAEAIATATAAAAAAAKPAKRPSHRWTIDQDAEMMADRVTKKHSFKEIAEKLGLDPEQVRGRFCRLIAKHKVPLSSSLLPPHLKMDSPAAAAADAAPPVIKTKKEDKVRPASSVSDQEEEEKEAPNKKARSDKQHVEELRDFLTTFPAHLQMVMFTVTRSRPQDPIQTYLFSVKVLEDEFQTTLKEFQTLPSRELFDRILKDPDSEEFEDDEDGEKREWYDNVLEAARQNDTDFSFGQQNGRILLATRQVPDFEE